MTEVRLEPFDVIARYAEIPTAFLVTSLLQPLQVAEAPGGFVLEERRVATPFIKNYDAIPENHPTDWARMLDTSGWQIFSAFVQGVRVGGAIAFVSHDKASPASPFADLWDLRVAPGCRRTGVASAIFNAVEEWALKNKCATLRIETQHINVAACQFYAHHGCELHLAKPGAYPDFPNEIRLIWYKPRARFLRARSMVQP